MEEQVWGEEKCLDSDLAHETSRWRYLEQVLTRGSEKEFGLETKV